MQRYGKEGILVEIVICQLTLEAVDSSLKGFLEEQCPAGTILVAKCIGCCGECASTYVVLVDGDPVVAPNREKLLERLRAL
ncbi:MAG: hypothetical protein DDT34_00402 [Firmicutes bacterium]|nr:hypothetical protein [Bacillota bacterium]MBT9158340.1 hypothetical protein [Bacillota bacterium]